MQNSFRSEAVGLAGVGRNVQLVAPYREVAPCESFRSIPIHPDPAGLWDKGCPSRTDPAKVQRLQPEHQQRRELVFFYIHFFSTHPADCKNDATCSPKTLDVFGGIYFSEIG